MAETAKLDDMRRCVYSWLQAVKLGWKQVKHLEDELCALRERLDGLNTATGEGVSGSGTGGGLDEGIARLAYLEEKWGKDAAKASKDYVDAMELCKGRIETWAVWLHIIERMTWHETGCMLGYSQRTMRRMGYEGVAILYEEMPRF